MHFLVNGLRISACPMGRGPLKRLIILASFCQNRGSQLLVVQRKILQSQGQRYRNALEKHVTATDIASAVAYSSALAACLRAALRRDNARRS
jgi:hypothetical protein